MLPNRLRFQSSSLRITKHEANYRKLNEAIVAVIGLNTAPRNAEEIWLELKANEVIISMATFHSRLKKLVDAGEVTKLKLGYNKYKYMISSSVENNAGI